MQHHHVLTSCKMNETQRQVQVWCGFTETQDLSRSRGVNRAPHMSIDQQSQILPHKTFMQPKKFRAQIRDQ